MPLTAGPTAFWEVRQPHPTAQSGVRWEAGDEWGRVPSSVHLREVVWVHFSHMAGTQMLSPEVTPVAAAAVVATPEWGRGTVAFLPMTGGFHWGQPVGPLGRGDLPLHACPLSG